MATNEGENLAELKARIAELESQLLRQQKHNERFERIVESSPNAIVVATSSGKIVLVNRMAEQLFGYSRQEFLTLAIESLVPGPAREDHQRLRQEFGLRPEMRQMGVGRELKAVKRDGSEFPVEIGLTPLAGEDGMQVLAVILDITERKQAEDELRRFARELTRSNAELESFVSIASHDLQEPLRKIRTMGERLAALSGAQLNEKASDYLRRMMDASDRMQQLIVDLLAFSRVSARPPQVALVKLNAPLAEVLTTLEIAIEEADAVLEIGDLPSAEVDVSQIRQLFQNLIGNALKFRRSGTRPVISVTGELLDGDQCAFTVRDNGIGFEQQYAERIFSIFQRLHGRHQYSGTGVGLAICKKIVDQHGGVIQAHGEMEKGASFRVILPCRQRIG